MNKIKRGLELSGAIVAISVASILTFSCIILLFASDLIDLGLGEINFEKSLENDNFRSSFTHISLLNYKKSHIKCDFIIIQRIVRQ